MAVTELVRALKALPPDSGHRIRVALAFRDVKRNVLARAIGIDETQLSRHVNGYRPWPEVTRKRVAEELGVPENLLFPAEAA